MQAPNLQTRRPLSTIREYDELKEVAQIKQAPNDYQGYRRIDWSQAMIVIKCLENPIAEYTTLVFESDAPLIPWRKLKCGDTILEPVFTSGLKDNMVVVCGHIDITGADVDFI